MKKIQLLIMVLLAFGSMAQAQEDHFFDFNRYKASIQAQTNLRFYRSEDEVRYVDYALIDIDQDGKSEVWVRGDEGQAWQGVFAIDGDSVVLLADADACSDLVFYKNAVGYNSYISPGHAESGISVLKNSKIVSSARMYKDIDIFSEEMETELVEYIIDGEYTDEESYDRFMEQLEWYTVEPVWHKIE